MTAQASEVLIYKGESLTMCSTPLDVYLENIGRPIRFQGLSTACWRGYVASWEVVADRLYITDISAIFDDGRDVSLEDLFPGYPEGAFAHWFTGEVRCPQGRQLKYVHMGFSSQFERDLFLTFKAGVLTSERTVVNGVASPAASNRYMPAAWVAYPPRALGTEETE